MMAGLPVLFEVNVAFELDLRLIRLEAALFQYLDDAQGLGIRPLSGFPILGRHADHFRIAAQEHVRPGRVEGWSSCSSSWPLVIRS